MNVWRIGSNWGGKDILNYFKNEQIAFVGGDENISKVKQGDIMAITRGQEIVGVGEIFDRRRLVNINPEYAQKFGDIEAFRFKMIFWEDEFEFDFGIYDGRGKKFHKAHNNYINLIKKDYNKAKNKIMEEEVKDLLKANKNLILNGAPGTGKTYLAQKAAEKLTGVNYTDENPYICFAQFHPSYDYTDFVEGLRPVKKEGEQELGFELRNGIFKELCKKAKEDNSEQKYIMIIDEINRAEISKVFGELFYSIEADYRGEKGKVKTQYANMQNEKSYFHNKKNDFFFVPENVYIIGTMNDIDRSVEAFDFAIRRRFAWKEIEADKNTAMLYEKISKKWAEEAENRMQNLNNAIIEIESLNKHYHIGPAYFLKINNYNGDFQKLWDYHIEPLLREYMRGLPEVEDNIKRLNAHYELNESN